MPGGRVFPVGGLSLPAGVSLPRPGRDGSGQPPGGYAAVKEAGMYGKVRLAGHPVHTMIVAFPVASYVGALAGFAVPWRGTGRAGRGRGGTRLEEGMR